MCGFSGNDQLLDHIFQLLSKEYRDDCRRRFIRSQPVIIARVSRRLPQKIRVFIHRFQDTRKHQQELDILMRRLSWLQQVLPIICGKGPVIMLSGTIHASKWLLMQQAFHAMLAGYPLQCLHNQMVVVDCHVSLRIDWCKLVLRRCHFVMLSLGRYAHLPQFDINVFHESGDSLADRSEVMVIQFLTLWRHGSKQGTSRIDQVFPLLELLGVNQEVFLFRSNGWSDFHGCRIPK